MNVAIVPIVAASPTEVAIVAAAIQKQVTRDFGPIWNVAATVSYFPTHDAVPLGYWPVFVVDSAPAAGTHIDHAGLPIAYVEYGVSWSLAASHEVLEMLADPTGTRVIAGDSPAGDRVEFLVEVCDPCQDAAHAYFVNGVLVSDFYTPAYFEPSFTQGSKYSFCGALRRPRDVLAGGYLTWRDPASGDWWQLDGAGATKNLGPIAGTAGFRCAVDAATPSRRALSHVPEQHPRMATRADHRARERAAIERRSQAWTQMLARERLGP